MPSSFPVRSKHESYHARRSLRTSSGILRTFPLASLLVSCILDSLLSSGTSTPKLAKHASCGSRWSGRIWPTSSSICSRTPLSKSGAAEVGAGDPDPRSASSTWLAVSAVSASAPGWPSLRGADPSARPGPSRLTARTPPSPPHRLVAPLCAKSLRSPCGATTTAAPGGSTTRPASRSPIPISSGYALIAPRRPWPRPHPRAPSSDKVCPFVLGSVSVLF